LTYSSFCKFSNLTREKKKICHLMSLKILHGFGWKDEFAREGFQDYIAHIVKVYMDTLKSCLAKPLDNAIKSYGLTSHVRRRHARVNSVVQIIADIRIHTHHSVWKRKFSPLYVVMWGGKIVWKISYFSWKFRKTSIVFFSWKFPIFFHN